MDAVRRANARLRELGYSPDEAAIEPTGSPTRLRLTGSLLRESSGEASSMLHVVRMLPPKADLLAFRHFLRLDDEGAART